MTQTYRFEEVIRKIGALYAVDVPPGLSAAATSGYLPVVGTANGFPFRAVLTPNSGGGHRLHLAAELRRQLGVGAGDSVVLMIQPDPTSRVPPAPDDLAAALDAVDGARGHYEELPPATKRQIVTWVESVGGGAGRARRIARVVVQIVDGDV